MWLIAEPGKTDPTKGYKSTSRDLPVKFIWEKMKTDFYLPQRGVKSIHLFFHFIEQIENNPFDFEDVEQFFHSSLRIWESHFYFYSKHMVKIYLMLILVAFYWVGKKFLDFIPLYSKVFAYQNEIPSQI